eukprot:gb/GEZN01006067.1/.p1 GENE.gb/GEZN01006067.1/~~gb/GEZN01006067.1/.p1  ORF type:complete len:350 (-),score=55.30 gb/GEZN01006067.1/:625-1674(-)
MSKIFGNLNLFLDTMFDPTFGYDPSGKNTRPPQKLPEGLEKYRGHWTVWVQWNWEKPPAELWISEYGIRFKIIGQENAFMPLLHNIQQPTNVEWSGKTLTLQFYHFAEKSDWTTKVSLINTLKINFASQTEYSGTFIREGEGPLPAKGQKLEEIKDGPSFLSGNPHFQLAELSTEPNGRVDLGPNEGKFMWALSLGFASQESKTFIKKNADLKMANGTPFRYNTWWDDQRIGFLDTKHELVKKKRCAAGDWMYIYKDVLYHAARNGGGLLVLLSYDYFMKKGHLNLNCLREIMFAQRLSIAVHIKFMILDEPGGKFFRDVIRGNLLKADGSGKKFDDGDLVPGNDLTKL